MLAGALAGMVRMGLFAGLIYVQVIVFMQTAHERMTQESRQLQFLGTALFVMLACSTLDAFMTDYSQGKPWARPIKAAFFLPCVMVVLLYTADYPDSFGYQGPLSKRAMARSTITQFQVFCDLTKELAMDALLATGVFWFVKILISDPEDCSIFASAGWYGVPFMLYLLQPTLRRRIMYFAGI